MLKLNFVGVFAIFNRAEILAYTETYEQPCKQINLNDFALIAKEEQSNPYVPFGYETETSRVNA